MITIYNKVCDLTQIHSLTVLKSEVQMSAGVKTKVSTGWFLLCAQRKMCSFPFQLLEAWHSFAAGCCCYCCWLHLSNLCFSCHFAFPSFNLLLSSVFNFNTKFKKVILHLQLLQNAGYIPHIVQHILVTCHTPNSLYLLPTPILPLPTPLITSLFSVSVSLFVIVISFVFLDFT